MGLKKGGYTYSSGVEKYLGEGFFDLQAKWEETVASAWNDGYRKGRQDGALFGELRGE